METKHTPGPWIFERILNTQFTNIGTVVAQTTNAAGDSGRYLIGRRRDDCFGDKEDSNARLIAAAPDLLESLKYCSSLLFQASSKANELSDRQKTVNVKVEKLTAKTMFNKARAAIAKAEG